MTYQKVTGALMANSHPGSYCGQDAYNDMLIVGKRDVVHRERTATPGYKRSGRCFELYARPADNSDRGGYELEHTVTPYNGGEVSQTLDANYYKGAGERTGTEREVLAVDVRNSVESEVNGSLQSKASNNLNSNNVCREETVVRRLTPKECERLQGFPDDWTNIGEWVDSKGKKHKEADSPRYKALGNSIALPFWEWMAKRMVEQLGKENPTMGSLFDGIGGFPLVYQRAGCTPVWASEIEEFCIAVTKKHFPEEEEEK